MISVLSTTKVCSSCRKPLAEAEFAKSSKSNDGLQETCKVCKRAYNVVWFKKRYADPEFRAAILRSNTSRKLQRTLVHYDITPERYAELTALGCGICGSHEPDGRGRFHFDHDHATGEFRGLLCTQCNAGLGLFGDDAEVMTKAINYLNKKGRGN